MHSATALLTGWVRWLIEYPDPLFAVGLLVTLWLSRKHKTALLWAGVLFATWLVSEELPYLLGGNMRLLIGLWTDAALALIALLSFTYGRAPWWVLALSLTWIAQILTHFTFDDDIPTMGLVLNVLCAAQIGLVCCDRPTRAGQRWWAREGRSHGRVAAASRYSTRALGGPDCRAGAMRCSIERMEGRGRD